MMVMIANHCNLDYLPTTRWNKVIISYLLLGVVQQCNGVMLTCSSHCLTTLQKFKIPLSFNRFNTKSLEKNIWMYQLYPGPYTLKIIFVVQYFQRIRCNCRMEWCKLVTWHWTWWLVLFLIKFFPPTAVFRANGP